MTRNIFCTLFALLLAAGAARAADDANWKTDPGWDSVKKVLEFVLHDDGNVYAITHNRKIWKHDRANKTWTEIVYTLAGAAGGASGKTMRVPDTTWKPAVLPQMVSFNSKLYIAVQYKILKCVGGGSYAHYTYPELDIVEIPPAGGAATIRLQIRGKGSYGWVNHCQFPAIQQYNNTIVDGYLFKDAGNLYWAGGGGTRINPVEGGADVTAGFTAGGKTNDYLYESNNGTTWSLKGRKVLDQYGRDVPRAMPNGYRYNHIIAFGGKLWDYYGYYNDTSPFAFTAKIDGVHTEPWGRFQMGAGEVNTVNRLFRVGFNKKGDKNYIYSITGTAGTWAKYPNANAPNDGSYYWRGFAVLKNVDDVNDDSADPLVYNESWHNGVYATYSKGPAGGYESGVYRYADHDGDGGWTWSKVRSTGNATTYTGGIFAVPNDVTDPTKGSIFVGTTNGVYRRGTGRFDFGLDNVAGGGDDINVMPQ